VIEVNLLPEEWRPKERTPWPRFAVILATVVIGGIEAAFLAGLMINKIPAADLDLTSVKKALQKKTVELDRKKKIAAKVQEYRKQLDAMVKLRESQTLWTKKLASLSSNMVTPNGVWITKLTLQESAGGFAGRGGAEKNRYLVINGYARGDPEGRGMQDSATMLKKVKNFMKYLQDDKKGFYEDFEGEVEMSDWAVTEIQKPSLTGDDDLTVPQDIPKTAASFELRCKFKKRTKKRKPSGPGGVAP